MKDQENPLPRGDSVLLQKGYTPKTTLSPDAVVAPQGGTGETTLSTHPPAPENPPPPPPKKD